LKLNLQYPFLEAIRDEKEGEETTNLKLSRKYQAIYDTFLLYWLKI